MCVGSFQQGAQHESPLVLVSDNSGQSWDVVPAPILSTGQPIYLSRVRFQNSSTGFAAGHSNGNPVIFRWDATLPERWVDVSPSTSGAGTHRIRDLALYGTSYASMRSVAVGNGGAAYYYNAVANSGQGQFEPLLPIFGGTAPILNLNLQSVAIAGSGAELVVGAEPWNGSVYFNPSFYDSGDPLTYPALVDPEDIGMLLRCDISNFPAVASHSKVKALTNDGIIDIFVSSQENLYLIGNPLERVGDSEVGSVSDVVFLRMEL